MKAWLSQHIRTLGATLAKLARAPVSTLLNVGAVGVALALPVGLYVGLASLQHLAGGLRVEPQVSLFLARDAGRGDVAQIDSRLKQHPGVRGFRHVSRERALEEIKTRSGLADVVESLGHNPLPDAFIVDASDAAPQNLEALRAEFLRWPKVAHVQLDSAWARRLDAVLRLGRLAVLTLGTLLAFALVAITFNTIRLQIMTQRDEIEVVKLIGATDPFVRRPFLYYGATLGLAGGVAAWLIVAAGICVFNDGLQELSGLYGMRFELRSMSVGDSFSLLAFSAWLGWFGAWLSVSRHLSDFEPR
ncbi:MAG: ABC transporter permease [Betaproteobacteria bacterium]|nr:ABC transporter permease [Betaproteobacteria bacterium]